MYFKSIEDILNSGILSERISEGFSDNVLKSTRLEREIFRDIRDKTPEIKEFETEVVSTNPFENAQVCCGGVDVRDINPYTMESKIKKGLYLTGELLDVDGICGGYNLQWAYTSARLVADALNERRKDREA